ncbi:MAG: hypothetical protein ACYDH6_19470 [Acidimicrobiales bacterium]
MAIHPGGFTNPLQTLRALTATSDAIDDAVLALCGFGLSDLIEVGLSYGDARLTHLRGSWSADPLDRDLPAPDGEELKQRIRRIARAPVALTVGEVEASARARDVDAEDWISVCAHPIRARSAWEWASRESADPTLDGGRESSPLGATLSVKRGAGNSVAVPAALILEALVAATEEMATRAARDGRSRRRMQAITEDKVLAVLNMSGPAGDGESPSAAVSGERGTDEEIPRLVMVAVPGKRHAYVIGVTSGLDKIGLGDAVDRAVTDVCELPLECLSSRTAELDLEHLDVHRIVIFGGPFNGPPPLQPGVARIHVEDFLEASIEAGRSDVGQDIGRAYLWQFLAELTSMPGVDRIAAVDFDDVWRHWLRLGVLNPSGLERVGVPTDMVPDERAWRTAATWEPVEAVLTAAGLPPSWEWLAASLDAGDGQATVGAFRFACLILADPPIVVSTPIDETLGDIGVDPAFAYGLADGIRLTIANNREVGDAVRMVDGRPLTCHVHIRADRAPDAPSGHVGIGVAADNAPARVSLLLGGDWLELLAENPEDAHDALGQALAAGVGQLHGVVPDQARRLADAWALQLPIAKLRVNAVTLPMLHQGCVDLPRSPATAAVAKRAIAIRLVGSHLPTAIYHGRPAGDMCRDVLIPAAQSTLNATITAWSDAALEITAKHLNDAHADRIRRAEQLALALAGPWAEQWQTPAMSEPEPAARTRILELLFEALLIANPSGPITPDQYDIAVAADIAHQLLDLGLASAAKTVGMHDLAVITGHGGYFTVAAMPGADHNLSVAIDVPAYLSANRADHLRAQPALETIATAPVALRPNDSRGVTTFPRLADLAVPKSLLSADSLLRNSCGTGIDGINAVLGTTVTWTDTGDQPVHATVDDVRREAADWSGLALAEIDAALACLTLDPEAMRRESSPPWEQERRRNRLATRPLVRLSDNDLLIIPWRIRATQEVYSNYLTDGRLPWPPSDIPETVRNAFNNYRQRQNEALEREACQIAADLRLPRLANLKPNKAKSAGLKLPGELDLLVADPERRRLWVCEVKDITRAVSPTTISARVAKFVEPKGFVHQLLALADAVRTNTSAAAEIVGAGDRAIQWRVVPVMITRRVEPAAFSEQPQVPFTCIADLQAILLADNDPPIGQGPIGGHPPGEHPQA